VIKSLFVFIKVKISDVINSVCATIAHTLFAN